MTETGQSNPNSPTVVFVKALGDHCKEVLDGGLKKSHPMKFAFFAKTGQLEFQLAAAWFVNHSFPGKSWTWRDAAIRFLWNKDTIVGIILDVYPERLRGFSLNMFFFAYGDLLGLQRNWEGGYLSLETLGHLFKSVIQTILSIPDNDKTNPSNPLPVDNVLRFLSNRSAKRVPEGAVRVMCSSRETASATGRQQPGFSSLPFLTQEDILLRGSETWFWFLVGEHSAVGNLGGYVYEIHVRRIVAQAADWKTARLSDLEKRAAGLVTHRVGSDILEKLQITSSGNIESRATHLQVLVGIAHGATRKTPIEMKNWMDEAIGAVTPGGLSGLANAPTSPRLAYLKGYIQTRLPWLRPRSSISNFSMDAATPRLANLSTSTRQPVLADVSNKHYSASSTSGTAKGSKSAPDAIGSLPPVQHGQGLGIQNVDVKPSLDKTLVIPSPAAARSASTGSESKIPNSNAAPATQPSASMPSAQPEAQVAHIAPSSASQSTSADPQTDSDQRAVAELDTALTTLEDQLDPLVANIQEIQDLVEAIQKSQGASAIKERSDKFHKIDQDSTKVLVALASLREAVFARPKPVSKLSNLGTKIQEAVLAPFSSDRKRKASNNPQVPLTPNLKSNSGGIGSGATKTPLLNRPAKQQRIDVKVNEETDPKATNEVAGPSTGPSTSLGVVTGPTAPKYGVPGRRPKAVEWMLAEEDHSAYEGNDSINPEN